MARRSPMSNGAAECLEDLRALLPNYRRNFMALAVAFRLPRDHGVHSSDSPAFITGSFQAFVGDLRPRSFSAQVCRLVRMPFGIIRSPRH
jgi:hypothetical protein